MGSFLKFSSLERLKLILSAALLATCTNHVFATAEETYFTANNYAGGSGGGSFTVSATINSDNNCNGEFDDTWNSHTEGTAQIWSIELTGSGSHPITSTDVSYPLGTPDINNINFPGSGNAETESYTINCTNTALDYDKNGTITIQSDCTSLTTGYSSASVTIYNTASIMDVAILVGGTNYGGDYIIRGEGNQTNYIHIYRGSGDTLNSRVVNFTVGGNAVSGTDYNGISSGANTVTIPSGTNGVVIPIKAVANTNIIGTRIITITLNSGYYQINTNAQVATIGIIQDVPTFSVTAPQLYSSPNSNDVGEFTITRTGGMSNSVTANLAYSGTAPGTDYTSLPTSVKFGTNQASTNLFVYTLNQSLATNETVVLSILTNSAYEPGITTDAVVTLLPNSETTDDVISPEGRYWRGSGTDPTYWSMVVPLNAQTGTVYSNLNGNCSSLYPGLTSWSSTTYYHYNASNSLSQSLPANRIPFNNPIVAFGERVGGTPLYYGQSYQYGIYAGDSVLSNQPIVIQAYYRTNYQLAGTVNIYAPSIYNSNSNAWVNYTTNGFQFTTNAYGLTTIVSGSSSLYYGAESWGALVLTHTATSQSTNYYYVVGIAGYPADGIYPMAVDSGDNIQPSLLYSLEFESLPPWRSTFIDNPHFDGKPLPPFYDGMTLAEMMTNSPAVTNVVSFTPSSATNLDDSPELRRSPILDNFVASMNNDPVALANFVINQIGLTDPIDYNESGSVSEQSINLGGITRGALGTFQERQGSPYDQCALLVYLLRQAGVPAVYEFAPHNGLMMLDSRLSQMFRFQVHGDLNDAGVPFTTNTMIAVNYPWVAAYIGTNWVHIFPWIKDTEITQGLNLWEEMPSNYTDAYQWIRDYIYGNTNLLSLAQNGDDTLRVIFPAYLQQTLLQNHPGVSVDDIGDQVIDRQHYYASWSQFPTPTWVTNTSTAIESLSSSTVTNVDPQLTNVFDTVSVEIQSVQDPTKDIKTGDMPLVLLENREFYVNQFVTNGNVQLNLVLMPFRTNITTVAAFTNDATLLDKEVLSLKFDEYDGLLNINFRYKRHKAIAASYPQGPTFLDFGGLIPDYGAQEEIDFTRPLLVGDQAAICMDYGQVSPEMLNADAQSLWQMEQTLRKSPSQTNSVSSDVYEGELMYLAGMSYYEKCDEFDEFNQRIQGVDQIGSFAAGLSKIIPASDGPGTTSTDPVLPCVDMFTFQYTAVGNDTIQPGSGQDYTQTIENFDWLLIANDSAEEHQVINRFYQQTNAVSTVRLLQLAQKGSPGIVALNRYNYVSEGTTNFQGLQLQNWDSGIWQSVTSAFQDSSSAGYVSAYITPGPMTNALYKGMAALILSPYLYEAIISPHSLNGGFGSQLLPAGTVSAVNTPNYNVYNNNDDYEADLVAPSTSDKTVAPDQTASFNAAQTSSQISSGVFTMTPTGTSEDQYAAYLYGLTQSSSASSQAIDFLTSDQSGNLGFPQDGGASQGSLIADPVRPLTGEYYVQETDLQLPGPIPLALHRNYSSQNLANNQFGYGWKLSIMPYLVISTKATNIYAADMDGAVLDYVHSTNSTSTNLWSPTLAANPQLNNDTTAGVGGLANRLRDYLLRSVSGSITNYTLYGADGSVRIFQFMKFESGTITNDRPYLTQWTDSRGNYYTFTYDTNSADADYSQMTRIKCSNGNYFNFDYDIYGHMVDAYTGDGRWIYYDYDEYGDLTTVTLPDGTTRSYQYLHGLQPVTNSSVVTQVPYSTHLIIEEDKPDGRELLNAYDSNRRVTNQWSTAGSDLNPILTASFIYSNNFNITNTWTNTITGYTYVIDGNGNTNRYEYTNSLLTKITDPLNQTVQQIWYPDNATSPGYPRSVKERIDKRGLTTVYLYDSNGNITNTVFTGDLTGDGVATQTTTNNAVYNTNSLPVQLTDPAGNSVVTVYDPVFTFLPSQVIRYAGGTPISTNYMIYGNATNVVQDGNLMQTNLAFGLNTQTIRAYGTTDAATNDTFYNGQGFPTETIRFTGTSDPNITNYYFYNERDLMVYSTDAVGAVTFYDYDPMNRPIEKENIDEFGNTISLATTYYNENGETNWTDGPQYNPDNYTYFDYDGMGRLTTKIHWRSEANSSGTGVEQPSGYNLYEQTFYQYDPLGNMLLMVDPRGAMTTNNYDALCRLTQSTHLDTDGATVLSSDGYSYEPGGEVQTHTNALGGVTTLYYNIMGQPEFQQNPDGSTNGWRYYLDGRVYKQIQGNGAYWQTTYDDADRITTQVFYSPTGAAEATNSYQLDRRGNKIQTVDAAFIAFNSTYDGLDRLKSTSGPATTNITETGMSPGSLTYITNVTQHIMGYIYDAAGRFVTASNALGQLTVNQFDSIARPVSTKNYNSTGTLVHQTYFSYSLDNNSETVTNGLGADAIVKTTWFDTDGHTVLSIGYPSSSTTEFTENQFDLAGNLVLAEHNSSSGGLVTPWTSSSSTYDGLNRVTSTTDRDGAETYYAYDPLNDLTNRTIPGDSQWQATYNSAAQLQQERDFTSSGGAVRTISYSYYPQGNPFAGLLYQRTDARGTTCTYSYDDWLRTTNSTCVGSLPEQNLITTWKYEPRGYLDGMTEQFANTNTGPSTFIQRNYDAYGELTSESVSDGSFGYGAGQSWDVTGRRSMLGIGNNDYSFGYQGDGNMISVGEVGTAAYSYNTAGILTNRLVSVRNTGITSLDGEGRPLTVGTTIDGEGITEYLSYSGDGLLQSDTLYRPDFTDSRSYAYASLSRRLTTEQLNLSISATWTNNFTYDNGTAAGPGTLTQMGQANSSSGLWNGGIDSFSRINSETNNTFVYPAYGHVNGQATLSAYLDSVPISIAALGTNAMQWQANMELSPGSHQLTVAALHPSGRFTAWATNYFTNSLAFQQTVDSYDANGDITNRVWENPSGAVERTQTLSWDARGRLHAITQRDANNSGYNWSAVYDPFNRRISTTTILVTNGVVYPSSVQTINSYYDPQVEFLELGVSYGTHTEWKLYGPDMNGQYGGMNGVGGLDGVSPGLSLFNPTASDVRGNILAFYDSSIGSVTWNAARPTGYGAVPNYRPVALADGATLAQSSAWRGHWVDITGYYNIGMRPYDPISGRWLTYDSLWNARDPNYYTFCGGDPINSFDRDGRISNATYLNQSTFGQQQFTYDPQLLAEINSEFSPPQLTPDQMYQLLPPSATVGIGIIDPSEIASEQQYENEPTAQKVAQAFPFGDLGYQIYSDSASGNLDALGQDSQQVAADAIFMILTEGLMKYGASPEVPNTPNTPAPEIPNTASPNLDSSSSEPNNVNTGNATTPQYSQADVQTAIGQLEAKGVQTTEVQSSIDPNQVISLAQAMESGGFQNSLMESPVIVDPETQAIVAGNHRMIAAQMTGFNLEINYIPGSATSPMPLSSVPLQTGRVNPPIINSQK